MGIRVLGLGGRGFGGVECVVARGLGSGVLEFSGLVWVLG